MCEITFIERGELKEIDSQTERHTDRQGERGRERGERGGGKRNRTFFNNLPSLTKKLAKDCARSTAPAE